MLTSFRLSTFYLLYFLSIGVTLPFMPAYFQSLGFSPERAGALLSVLPVCSMVLPPVWGQVADRTGRPGVVLLVLCVGGLFGYTLLLGASSFVGALLAMGVYSVFGSAITAIIDSIAMQHVLINGGEYSHLRRWGSFGFVVSTLAFGYSIKQVDRVAVLAPIAFLAAASAWCAVTLARAPKGAREGPKPSVKAAIDLLRDKQLVLLLIATTLHWLAGTPYHGSLGPHYLSLGLQPWAISLTWGAAVGSEVIVLSLYPRWSHRISTRWLLICAFSISAFRWFAMASTSNVVALTLLATLHGLTFGAFYVAAVNQIARHAPGSLRATGQSLFVAMTFGFGGLVGFSGSGALYSWVGGHRLFAFAGVLELLPLAVAAFLLRRDGPPGNRHSVVTVR